MHGSNVTTERRMEDGEGLERRWHPCVKSFLLMVAGGETTVTPPKAPTRDEAMGQGACSGGHQAGIRTHCYVDAIPVARSVIGGIYGRTGLVKTGNGLLEHKQPLPVLIPQLVFKDVKNSLSYQWEKQPKWHQ